MKPSLFVLLICPHALRIVCPSFPVSQPAVKCDGDQIMRRLLAVYERCLKTHPWKTQIVGTGILVGAGDLLLQFVIERRNLKTYEPKRTARFVFLGAFYCAPLCRFWYNYLSKLFVNAPKLAPVKRMLLDQLCLAPLSLSIFIYLNGLTQRAPVSEIKDFWTTNFVSVYEANLTVWPAVQLFNFYLVPLASQVIFVQFIAVFWNTYLAYRTNRSL